MWIQDFFVSVWSIFVISSPTILCSGWKPIAPPAEYLATKPTTCISDCDVKIREPLLDESGGALAETQLKSTLVNQPVVFTQHKSYQETNKILDLDVFKPTEVSFFPQGEEKSFNSPLPAYQEAFGNSPTSYYSIKLYGAPQKPAKTIYYGNLELAKPKLTNSVKYYKPYKPNDFKVIKPANFKDNEVSAYQPLHSNIFDKRCALHKISFRQDIHYQYVQYKVHMPELKEFTLCLWSRFYNNSHDHTLFSYGAKNHHKSIYLWVSNIHKPGFFNMKVMGQAIYRLNFPIQLYKWYHTCHSWNGRTGEWQVWVDSHRIARGFHNLLVGRAIPGGGVALSGQDTRHFGKSFQEIPDPFKGSGGLEGEITMLQLYKVALTAGKAFNDHTHHHSHHMSTTAEPPDIPDDEPPKPTTHHPFLANGQLKPHINILELAEALKHKPLHYLEHEPSLHHLDHDHYHKQLSHPYVSHVAPLAVHGNTLNLVGLPNHAIFKRNDESESVQSLNGTVSDTNKAEEEVETTEKVKVISNVSDQVRVEKVKFISESLEDQVKNETVISQMEILKENASNEESMENYTEQYQDDLSEETTHDTGFRTARKRLKRQNSRTKIRLTPVRQVVVGRVTPVTYTTQRLKKQGDIRRNVHGKEKEVSKRLVVYEDHYPSFGAIGLTSHELHTPHGEIPFAGFAHDNLSNHGHDLTDFHVGEDHHDHHDDNHDEHHENEAKMPKKEVELAQNEVIRVLEVCSGCQSDPFMKVAVISWRATPKKISGALLLKAKPECHNF